MDFKLLGLSTGMSEKQIEKLLLVDLSKEKSILEQAGLPFLFYAVRGNQNHASVLPPAFMPHANTGGRSPTI